MELGRKVNSYPKGCWFESNWRSFAAGQRPGRPSQGLAPRSKTRKRHGNDATVYLPRIGQFDATHRSPAAPLLRDVLRALPLIALLGGGPAVAVAILGATDHTAAAWVVVFVGSLVGVAMARTGVPARRPARHRSASLRRIHGRANGVLAVSALVLATVMGTLAVLR